MNPLVVRFDALAIADGDETCASPGSVLVRLSPGSEAPASLLAAGPSQEVAQHPRATGARVVSRPECVLIPGLVNAHTHLDLTHIGPRPFDPGDPAGFPKWIDLIRAERATEPAQIEASVLEGARRSLQGGVVAVGDIGGAPRGRPSLAPWRALQRSPLVGVSFLEFFAIGGGFEAGTRAVADLLETAAIDPEGRIRLGIQPHAPTTVEPAGFAWAAERAMELMGPISTHLAETAMEREFISRGTGPQREFLASLGLWDDRLLSQFGRGTSPVAHLAEFLREAPGTLVAHVNDADDDDIQTLAEAETIVVYCPRASAYFGAERHFGPHRYRDMLEAGIPVALGTDSIVNLPPGTGAMSTLDEIRFLYERDGTDPALLLRMATTTGASALDMDPLEFRLGGPLPHALAGLVAVPVDGPADNPCEAVARSRRGQELLFDAILSDFIGSPPALSV